VRTAKTDAKGRCRFDIFQGWIGISEKDERFAAPRSVLAMSDLRSVRFCVVKKPANVRLTVEGLPEANFSITERGLVVEGEWTLPAGFKPGAVERELSFLQGKSAEFFTPVQRGRGEADEPRPQDPGGEMVSALAPGEDRKHTVSMEEVPHLTIQGETAFEPSDLLSREHCGIELYDGGPSGRLLRAAGSLGGPRHSPQRPGPVRVPRRRGRPLYRWWSGRELRLRGGAGREGSARGADQSRWPWTRRTSPVRWP
jgi:hypothetical protein